MNRDQVRWQVQAARVRSTLDPEAEPLLAVWVEKGGSKKTARRNLNPNQNDETFFFDAG
jgi:hypothetical protein